MRGALERIAALAAVLRAAADDPDRALEPGRASRTHVGRMTMSDYQREDRNLALDSRAGDRGGGLRQRPADGPRRREGGRPGRGRRHAPGAERARHRRHGGDRRGRARRGADALYRREGRHRAAGPKVDIALDPLEGTTITATGGAQRDRLPRHGGARRLPQRARHLHGQDRRRRRPAAGIDRPHRPARPRTSPAWPRPRACRSRIWSS